ncbi:exopolysaccharide biosynthesis protein [Plastoroseomonas arctica]|uniref:Exopolysaccharide biosynthesis protein n=1 Tax=Plastoroseomonas arctica TaxID=1509237 RepID=A0AAF1JYA6_9PROT|nr:exopolysaccharide biosynthesis protein [Plastoroseomonas arctica]MBR0656762.1 exopolysaccharide biosynthesis protein [Plastoroseomonas arctica]
MDATGADTTQQAPISRLLHDIAARCPNEEVSLGDLADMLGDRGFGILILLLGLPAFLPGVATVFGLPILVLGVQMGLGLRRPRFPAFVARQHFKRSHILRMAQGSSRWLARIEGFVRPRPGPFVSNLGDRVVGWLTAYAAIMIILPGPGTNGPPAFGSMVMALGVVESDNRTVGIGIALTILGNAFATGMLIAIGWLGVAAFQWVF